MITSHNFDFVGLSRQKGLDYYNQVKVVNYIRRQVYKINILRETFEGETFANFACFVPISESFLCDCLKARWTADSTSEQAMKITTHERL